MGMYEMMIRQMEALLEEETNYVSVLSNASALLMETLDQINWAGFYLVRDGELKLGPFQGKTACVRIRKGRGVCGTAWETDRTQLVPDVHAFPGHIACDSASRSEIVIPLHHDGEVVGVLDIDSPETGRFSEEDRAGLEQFAELLEAKTSW